MKNKNKVSIGFNLDKIKTDQFALFEENFKEDGKIDLETNLSFALDLEKRSFLVSTKFVFMIRKKPFMSIQVSCYFTIVEDAWMSFIKDNTITFPKGFVAHMSMLSVGTARGVLHVETNGTIFNRYILPTVNVSEMLSKDVTFEL